MKVECFNEKIFVDYVAGVAINMEVTKPPSIAFFNIIETHTHYRCSTSKSYYKFALVTLPNPTFKVKQVLHASHTQPNVSYLKNL
jgi:hypothetical protein